MNKIDLRRNPFEFDAAGNLGIEDLLDVFVEDHNFSRFICAPRNVFLIGERGSGKSMTLRFNEFRVRKEKSERLNSPDSLMDYVGILVECKNPLYARKDDSFKGADEEKILLISEHLFVTDIGQALATSLMECQKEISEADQSEILETLSLFFDENLKEYSEKLFEALRKYFKKLNITAQKDINAFKWDEDGKEYATFASTILPVLEELRNLELFKSTHFMIMIDDAQKLNSYQKNILNTWVSYRNQTVFSFKIGCANSEYSNFHTLDNAPILEGHDYIVLDMEQPFQNIASEYGQFARKVLSKRLNKIGGLTDTENLVDDFFPESERVKEEIEKYTKKEQKNYLEKNPKATAKQIRDWGYKYGRAAYFKDRHPKANLPSYSGFNTISHLSTGVVRYLLQPCYLMYDTMLSKSDNAPISSIPPEIQSEVIKNQSDALWSQVKELDRRVPNCTEEDAELIYNLLEALGNYFLNRLLHHKSEPRILTFTISGNNNQDSFKKLSALFSICRESSLIYIRRGVARDKGKREDYYTLNRMLWPIKGLDPIGQHGRASIPLDHLFAATKGQSIPYETPSLRVEEQQELSFILGETSDEA